MDPDRIQRVLKLVEEACNAMEALLGDWIVLAEADDEAPPEVVAWLRREHNKHKKFAAQRELQA